MLFQDIMANLSICQSLLWLQMQILTASLRVLLLTIEGLVLSDDVTALNAVAVIDGCLIWGAYLTL